MDCYRRNWNGVAARAGPSFYFFPRIFPVLGEIEQSFQKRISTGMSRPSDWVMRVLKPPAGSSSEWTGDEQQKTQRDEFFVIPQSDGVGPSFCFWMWLAFSAVAGNAWDRVVGEAADWIFRSFEMYDSRPSHECIQWIRWFGPGDRLLVAKSSPVPNKNGISYGKNDAIRWLCSDSSLSNLTTRWLGKLMTGPTANQHFGRHVFLFSRHERPQLDLRYRRRVTLEMLDFR